MRIRSIALSLAGVVVVGSFHIACSKKAGKRGDGAKNPSPPSFQESVFSEIVPLANGGAYAPDVHGRIWYLTEASASPVNAPGMPDPLLPDITPLANGDAYVTSLTGGIWHLRGASGERVVEGVARRGAAIEDSSHKGFFTLYVRELQRRRKATTRAEAAEDAATPRSNDDNDPCP